MFSCNCIHTYAMIKIIIAQWRLKSLNRFINIIAFLSYNKQQPIGLLFQLATVLKLSYRNHNGNIEYHHKNTPDFGKLKQIVLIFDITIHNFSYW